MTPDKQPLAGQAAASALKPDHTGHGGPLESGSPENWEGVSVEELHADRYANEPEAE